MPESDFTAEEVDEVIEAALSKGTRLISVEIIEQMRQVLLAAASAPEAPR
ncbi:hypothetical protein OCJ37_19785 [Xanthomonas sp. AM6]|nr:hypothetical protein [Xanthomonas sp. AM6]UYB52175.1 hypothetical protein OCJ37_19785 [Xanthomonas sp. AM6]